MRWAGRASSQSNAASTLEIEPARRGIAYDHTFRQTDASVSPVPQPYAFGPEPAPPPRNEGDVPFPAMTETSPTPTLPDDEIDLRELFLTLWGKRRLIALSSLATLALSAVYAFVIAKPVFESSALLLPTQTSASSDLGAAAALLGGKKGGSADVDLYQSLLTSRTVIHKLLGAPMRNMSDTGAGRIEPLYRILKLDTTKALNLEGAIEGLSKSVTVDSKESGAGGILEIKFSAGAPWLAQQIGNTLLAIGQEELRVVRIERSDVILSRLGVAVAQARSEWDSTARTLTWYKDRNRSISLPDQMLELSRLEMEKSAKEQKYLLARKEYESQELEKEKAAPPMMILDPADLPAKKSKPKRSLILALGLMVGAMGSCVGVLGWKAFVIPAPEA
jgi:uncharacterized protein involved in exopolysaccharide biosynthesis